MKCGDAREAELRCRRWYWITSTPAAAIRRDRRANEGTDSGVGRRRRRTGEEVGRRRGERTLFRLWWCRVCGRCHAIFVRRSAKIRLGINTP